MLLVSLLAAALLGALAGGVVLTALTESAVAARYRDAVAVFYAADGGAEQGLARLAVTADWSPWQTTSWRPLVAGPDLLVEASSSAVVAGALVVRATASPAPGLRRTVELTVERRDAGVRVLSWRELR